MKVIVIGAAGLIGHNVASALQAAGHDVARTHRTIRVPDGRRVDMGDFDGMARLLDRVSPDAVVMAAGPSREAITAEPERAGMHLVAVRTAVRALHGTPALVVLVSSDEVFDGSCGPYLEDEPALPATTWGRMQLAAELLVSQEVMRSVVVRTSQVYGWDSRGGSPLTPIRRKLALMRPIAAPDDRIITPTYAPWLAQGIRAVCEVGATGVVNIAGPMIEEDQFLRQAAQAFGLNPTLVHGTPRHQLPPDDIPAHGGLVTARALDILGHGSGPSHAEALQEFAAGEPGVVPPSRRVALT